MRRKGTRRRRNVHFLVGHKKDKAGNWKDPNKHIKISPKRRKCVD